MATSPKMKLTYFIGRGRGETIRYLLAYGDQEYEDVRFEEWEWPGDWKKPTPFGQVPTLEIDGTLLCQSTAIARYLARKYGLAGKSDLDQAKVDMVVDCLEDFFRPTMGICGAPVEKKPELRKKYDKEQMPPMLDNLEKMLISNNGGDGYFVGDGMTWADIHFINVLTWPAVFNVTISWEKYPKLKALKDRVESHPKIAAWIERRPVSYY